MSLLSEAIGISCAEAVDQRKGIISWSPPLLLCSAPYLWP